MKSPLDFGSRLAAWAAREPAVSGLVLIGSRQRPPGDRLWRVDPQSDWDFQVITSRPEMFAQRDWMRAVPGVTVRAYALRTASTGGVPKANVVLGDTEADFVIIPEASLGRIKGLVAQGRHREEGETRRALQDLVIIIRPGWRFLKGERAWGPLYRRAVKEVPDWRMDNATVIGLAEVFFCDYVWMRRKLVRGEFVATQRVLHRELAEINFRFLHELRLRRGERSLRDARRIERISGPEELASVSLEADLTHDSLQAALAHSADTCRALVRALVGDSWRWPEEG